MPLENKPAEPSGNLMKEAPSPSRLPSIFVAVVIAAIAALSIWYLMRPQPLLVQGEVDATRLDIAARIDGRVADIPVTRGENVAAGGGGGGGEKTPKIAQREKAGWGEGRPPAPPSPTQSAHPAAGASGGR